MKKVITFVIWTVLLLILTGYYMWLNNKDHVETLMYIPDPDWSKISEVNGVNTHIYDCAIDEKGLLNVIWVGKKRIDGEAQIQHLTIDQNGQALTTPQTIISAPYILNVALGVVNGELHVFYTGQDTWEKVNLLSATLSSTGKILKQQQLYSSTCSEFCDLDMMQTSDGTGLLAWVERVEGHYSLKTLTINSEGVPGSLQSLISGNSPYSHPRILLDHQENWHLAWFQEISTEKYNLCYQQLGSTGAATVPVCIVDTGYIHSVNMTERDGILYLVWDKKTNTLAQSRDIFGTTINLQDLAPETIDVTAPTENIVLAPVKSINPIIQLTPPNSSNCAPALGFDKEKRLHLVYVKLKRDFRAIVDQAYSMNFTTQVQKTHWIYPEPCPSASEVTLLNDTQGNLYIACLGQDIQKNITFYYANSIKKEKVTPWQVIGINNRNYKESFFFNITYILSSPLINLLAFTIFFCTFALILFTSFLYSGIRSLLKKTKLTVILNNFYVSLAVIGIVQIFPLLKILGAIQLVWPLQIVQSHFWYIIGLASIATVSYSLVNRIHFKYNELLFASMLLIVWDYWIWVIIMTLNTPNINYIIPPML